MKNDYRNTRYYTKKNNIINEKKRLEDKIRKECPRTQIIYNQISQKEKEYNKLFREIYNNKCAYCGITTDVISSELLEIDHFICESSFKENKIKAGEINNLVLSCKKCNRAKSDFKWEEEYTSKFSVDDGNITELFYRDKDYSIKVEGDFISDTNICSFYKTLKFSDEVRRLDFLLMNLYGFYKKHINEDVSGKISKCIILLQQKRNGL